MLKIDINNRQFYSANDEHGEPEVNFDLPSIYRAEKELTRLQGEISDKFASITSFKNSSDYVSASGFESKISCAAGDSSCAGFSNTVESALKQTVDVRNALLRAQGMTEEMYEEYLNMGLDDFASGLDGGEVSQEYVTSLFYDNDGNPLYEGIESVSEPIAYDNGSVQVTVTVSEADGRTNEITITINPNHTDDAFVLAPGTGGGAFHDFVCEVASENPFTTVSYGTAPSTHTRSDAIIADVLHNINNNQNLDKSVVAGASAGGPATINMTRELMGITAKPVDIMLLDSADLNGGCQTFSRELLNDSNSDVREYLKNESIIYAYEAISAEANGGPGNSDKPLQDLADNGLTVVMCINENYQVHSGYGVSPETQAVNGEVLDVMNRGNSQVVLLSNDPQLGKNGNQYALYVPGGTGVTTGQQITNPITRRDLNNLLNK